MKENLPKTNRYASSSESRTQGNTFRFTKSVQGSGGSETAAESMSAGSASGSGFGRNGQKSFNHQNESFAISSAIGVTVDVDISSEDVTVGDEKMDKRGLEMEMEDIEKGYHGQ